MTLEIINSETLSPSGYHWSLKPFRLCLKGGCITIMQGDNGSGKSNLLKILSGVLLPDYSVNNFLPGGADCIRSAGFFQPIPFDPQLSLSRNMKLWGITPSLDDQISNYQANLDRLELRPYIKTKWGAASSGMRQKFGVAIALGQKADLYFLDEPLAHVDTRSTEIITDMIREKLLEGSAVLVTTHQIRNWSLNSGHYYYMVDGSINHQMQSSYHHAMDNR